MMASELPNSSSRISPEASPYSGFPSFIVGTLEGYIKEDPPRILQVKAGTPSCVKLISSDFFIIIAFIMKLHHPFSLTVMQQGPR